MKYLTITRHLMIFWNSQLEKVWLSAPPYTDTILIQFNDTDAKFQTLTPFSLSVTFAICTELL